MQSEKRLPIVTVPSGRPDFSRVRTLARAMAGGREESLQGLPERELRSLLRELGSYQLELESCNEELKKTQQVLQEARDRYADLFDFAPVAYFTLDEKGFIEEVNFTGCELFAKKRRDLLGQPFSRFLPEESLKIYHYHLQTVFRKDERQVCELALQCGDGTEVHVRMVSIGMPGTGGERRCRTAIVDITERKLAERRWEELLSELKHMSNHDALTGLPNRALFDDRLAQAIVQADRHLPGGVCLMMLDLDGFKKVNEVSGHHGGDQVLQESGRRLSRCIREADTVARYGGDEFILLLCGTERIADAEQIAQKILEALREPLQVGDKSWSITASIGISLYPQDADSAEELRKQADAAMFRAKAAGKGCYRFAQRVTQELTRH